jgi:hypothetical protein
MSKSKLSVSKGKHRKYICGCGKIRSVTLPLNPGRTRCGNCDAYLDQYPYTVEDLSVRRRDDAEGKR